MIVHVQFPDIRYLLQYPKDVTVASIFKSHETLQSCYCLTPTSDMECDVLITKSLDSTIEVDSFLNVHREFLIDPVKIGDLFHNGCGTTYLLNEFSDIVYNIPSTPQYPQIDNYWERTRLMIYLGISRNKFIGAYDQKFFKNETHISINELELLIKESE